MLLVKLARDQKHGSLIPNSGLVREMGPLISGKSRLVKYDSIWSDAWKSTGVIKLQITFFLGTKTMQM